MTWITSSYCSADKPQCVAVEPTDGGVVIRNTDEPSRWVFATWAEWDAFTSGVKDGEFDESQIGNAPAPSP